MDAVEQILRKILTNSELVTRLFNNILATVGEEIKLACLEIVHQKTHVIDIYGSFIQQMADIESGMINNTIKKSNGHANMDKFLLI